MGQLRVDKGLYRKAAFARYGCQTVIFGTKTGGIFVQGATYRIEGNEMYFSLKLSR